MNVVHDKLTEFVDNNQQTNRVLFVETQTVQEGVECDIYTFLDDNSQDLAIVRVKMGYKTPKQRVLSGKVTIEGYVSGSGILTITSKEGIETQYEFQSDSESSEVVVEVGQTMQWYAKSGVEDLCFYEVCMPPYKDGRFENL